MDAGSVRGELSRSCWRHQLVVREWSADRVWLAGTPRALVDKLLRGDIGYLNILGLVAFLVAALIIASLQSTEFARWPPQAYALVVGAALPVSALLYWSIREPPAVLDLRGSDLKVGYRRIDAASIHAVVMRGSSFEDFRVTEGGQSVSEELKIFYRLDVRTAGGSYQLVVSPSEHHWSVEEVAASRSFAEELARRLNTELECEDRR